MKSLRSNIPNFITLGNLLCGSLAVLFASSGVLGSRSELAAALLICLAAVLDFFDGLVARLLNVSSPMGRELDSLADVISFGLAPSILVLNVSEFLNHPSAALWLVPFLLVLGAAWRLARFNIDTEQSAYFKGLPAPANGIVWALVALWMLEQENRLTATPGWHTYTYEGLLYMKGIAYVPYWYSAAIVLFFLLMVSKLKLLNFKVKSLQWKGNQSRYAILIGSAALIAASSIVYGEVYTGLLASVLLYLVISIVHYYILKPHEIQSGN